MQRIFFLPLQERIFRFPWACFSLKLQNKEKEKIKRYCTQNVAIENARYHVLRLFQISVLSSRDVGKYNLRVRLEKSYSDANLTGIVCRNQNNTARGVTSPAFQFLSSFSVFEVPKANETRQAFLPRRTASLHSVANNVYTLGRTCPIHGCLCPILQSIIHCAVTCYWSSPKLGFVVCWLSTFPSYWVRWKCRQPLYCVSWLLFVDTFVLQWPRAAAIRLISGISWNSRWREKIWNTQIVISNYSVQQCRHVFGCMLYFVGTNFNLLTPFEKKCT